MKGVFALITARGGSKGLPRKNVLPLGGKPTISFSIRACLISSQIDRVVVSTDCDEIALISREYGAEVPFVRPAELARDDSTDLDVVRHFLSWLDENEETPEFIVHIRPTTPLRDPTLVDQAIAKAREFPDCTSLRSVHEMSESAYKYMEIESSYLSCVFSKDRDVEGLNVRRQDFPKTYVPNGYVDIIKPDFVCEFNKMHGNRSLSFVTPEVTEIDSQKEFDYLGFEISQNPNLRDRLF